MLLIRLSHRVSRFTIMLLEAGCVACASPSGPVCARCNAALRPAQPLTVPDLDACRAGFVFDEHVRPVIAAFKYRRQRRIASWCAASVADLVPRAADAITWIPATPARRRSRGFDQAAEIARCLSRSTGVPSTGLLDRARADDRQTGRTRDERQQGPDLVAKRGVPSFVVLIDDVVTTGSSMRVAARALRLAGADRVVGVAIAATPLVRDGCLPSQAIASIIRGWT